MIILSIINLLNEMPCSYTNYNRRVLIFLP